MEYKCRFEIPNMGFLEKEMATPVILDKIKLPVSLPPVHCLTCGDINSLNTPTLVFRIKKEYITGKDTGTIEYQLVDIEGFR